MTDPHSAPELRRRLRGLRADLSPKQLKIRGRLAARRVMALYPVRRADTIACYLPNDGEMDTRPLIEALVASGKRCVLPRLHPFVTHRLLFCRWCPGERLQRNRFGIPEPRFERRSVPPRRIDVVIVPLVGFDNAGHRLGMGGGYYDRSLWFRLQSQWRRPLLIGLAHDFQCVDELPFKPTDVAMDFIVTESRLHRPDTR